MGSHHPRHAAKEPRRLTLLALALVAPLALATLVALVVLWPSQPPERGEDVRADQVDGTVLGIERVECLPGEGSAQQDVNGCGTATVRLDSGADAGEEVETLLPNGPGAPELDLDDQVVLITTQSPDGETYSVVDHQRLSGLWILLVCFALAVVAFGRWRGLTALAGLALTFLLLVFFVVPAVIGGSSPLLIAIVGAAAIALAVLYLTHGFSMLTTVAVAGTLASLALTGVLGAVTVSLLHLTGVTDDISASLSAGSGLNTEGLLLAGIVIGSLGVLDDVTVTQVATVNEVARANPQFSALQLYRAGSRVGRSHIASVINTIVLAYAGASLPLMIIIVSQRDSLAGVISDQIIAQEIVRSIVATVGLIAAVPITTALAAFAVSRLHSATPREG